MKKVWFKISANRANTGIIIAWAYDIYTDGDYGCSNSVNNKYGILVDATDEEILAIGKEIVREAKDISDWDLEKIIPEEYLTEELKARKTQMLKDKAKNELNKLEEEIKEKQQKLRELKSKQV